MPATYDPERNSMVRLKCRNDVVYMQRTCPLGADPDPTTQCVPGVGIHMDCCRCDCPCEIICSNSSQSWTDPFEGSGPLGVPWATTGVWTKNGNSEVRLVPDTQGTAMVPIDAGSNELVLWLDGRMDTTTTPGDIIELGLKAVGLFGESAFALDFYIHRAVSGGLDYIALSVSVDGADPVDVHIDTVFQPNCDLEIRVYVSEDHPNDLTVCAKANDQTIADNARIMNVQGVFSQLNAGLRGTAIGTSTVYADSFTYCSPTEPANCIWCEPGFQPPASLHLNLPEPFDLGGETGACDCAPVLEKGTYGPLVFLEEFSPDPCIWSYEEEICTNINWCPGCGDTANPITLRISAQIIGGPPHKWRITISVGRDGPQDPTCECSFEAVYDSEGWIPPSFGGDGQCNDFPFTLTSSGNVLNTGWCGPIPGVGVVPPPSVILTDLNPGGQQGIVRMSSVASSISPRKPGAGTRLYSILYKLGILRNPRCKDDFVAMNSISDNEWETKKQKDWLYRLLTKEATRRRIPYTEEGIRRIVELVCKSKPLRQ